MEWSAPDLSLSGGVYDLADSMIFLLRFRGPIPVILGGRRRVVLVVVSMGESLPCSGETEPAGRGVVTTIAWSRKVLSLSNDCVAVMVPCSICLPSSDKKAVMCVSYEEGEEGEESRLRQV